MSVPMRRVSLSALRFQVKRAIQGLSRGTLRDLAGKPDRREEAIDLATDAVMVRVEGWEFSEPDLKPMDFADMDRGPG